MLDGGTDAHRPGDSGPVDGGPADAAWIRVEGLPPECDVRLAANPEDIVPPLEAGPCDGVSVGCRRVRFRPSPTGVVQVGVVAGRWDEAASTGWFFWAWSAASAPRLAMVSDHLGNTRVVLQLDASGCRSSGYGVGDGRVALALDDPTLVIAGRIDRPGEMAVVGSLPLSEIPALVYIQTVAVSERAIGLNNTGSAIAWRLGWDGAYRRLFTVMSGSVEPISDIHEDSIFATEISGVRNRVWVSDEAGDRLLVDPVDAEAGMLRTDGRTLAWQQGYERVDITGYSRLELWASPYATDALELLPRRIAVLEHDSLTNFDMYGNHAVAASTRTRAVVYPLDGGPPRVIAAPAGHEWGDIVFAGPEEVAMLLRQAAPALPVEVRFYRYDSLPLAE
jgi:hypothetical protein